MIYLLLVYFSEVALLPVLLEEAEDFSDAGVFYELVLDLLLVLLEVLVFLL